MKKDAAPPYTAEIFKDIGRAFCIGVLDFFEINTISRIPTCNLKSLEGVKKDILAHYPIFIPKKKEEEEKKKKQKREEKAKKEKEKKKKDEEKREQQKKQREEDKKKREKEK